MEETKPEDVVELHEFFYKGEKFDITSIVEAAYRKGYQRGLADATKKESPQDDFV